MSNERTSVFLETRVDQLRQAIEFFATKTGAAGTRRVMTFLTQIEFWNWEFDCIMYAMESFGSRSLGWRTPASGVEPALIELGFRLKRRILEQAKEEVRSHGSAVATVSVPKRKYNAMVAEWNALLERGEDLFDTGRLEADSSFGATLQSDLARFRKLPFTNTEPAAPPNTASADVPPASVR